MFEFRRTLEKLQKYRGSVYYKAEVAQNDTRIDEQGLGDGGMADVLLQFYTQQGQEERVIALADLLLKYAPKDVALMLYEGSASGVLARRDFVEKYPTPNDIPAQKRPYFIALERNNELFFRKAEALGWREPSSASRANYIKTVEQAKASQQ